MASLASIAGSSILRAAAAQNGKTLVVFMSRSGNTRVIAGQIARTLGAPVVEIEPAEAYPADYFETVEQARSERDNGTEPALKASVGNIAAFNTVFLCFPIWGETAPPPIRSFLSSHDLKGKTIVPVITHGGFGLGNSLDVVKSHAPQSTVVNGFSMQCPQERQTIARVMEWLPSVAAVPQSKAL